MTTAPSAHRQVLEEARALLGLLEGAGFATRLAGGCVRDRLLGVVPKDVDIATAAAPDVVQRVLSASGYKVVPTGLEHGTVTVVLKHGPVEVTTLRRDASTDGRWAAVEFHDDFRKDAARRDFTINAMFEDAGGEIYDYFGGQDDLAAERLAFVGVPCERLREDYLRILRLYRFWARLSFTPSTEALTAVQQAAPGLAEISRERIACEITGLLSAENPAPALNDMLHRGVWRAILPDPAPEALSSIETASPPIETRIRWLWRLALLYAGTPHTSRALDLRLARRDAALVDLLLRAPQQVESVQGRLAMMTYLDQVDRVLPRGFELAVGPFLMAVTDDGRATAASGRQAVAIQACEQSWGHLRRAPLPLDGRDLQEQLGIAAGPQLGLILQRLKDEFRQGVWRTREEGLQRASEIDSE